MISGDKIGTYFADPSWIDENDLADLAELIKKYPYCSSLYLLHLKGLAISNAISFENQLRVTSIHVSDREHLFAYIHSAKKQDSNKVVVVNEVENIEVKAETEVNVEIEDSVKKEELVVEEITRSADLVEDKTETQPEKPADIAEEEFSTQSDKQNDTTGVATEKEPSNTISSESEQETEIAQENTDEKHIKINDPLEINIINSAIDAAYSYEEIEISESENVPSEKIITPEKEAVEKEEPAEKITEELSFIEWLRLKQEKGNSPEIKAVPEKEIEAKTPVKIDANALLEKFIEEAPRISRPTKDFYNPVKNAQKSVEESDDIISETLAEIHVFQKNYSKAISAYKRLILLYPEKKAFFASRIEKIKQEFKN